jgi:hypothetical protein
LNSNGELTTEAELAKISTDQYSKCVSCSGLQTEDFCPLCGERKFDPHQLKLRHFLEQAVEGLTHADNRLFRSLKLLVTRPGFLTNEFMKGRRKPYLQPVQLFLVVNLVFFLVQAFSVLSPLTTELSVHMNQMSYGTRATKVIQQEIAKRHLSLEEYTVRFDAKEETEAKTLVIVMVPCFALAVALLQVQKARIFIQHLVFAFHFYAFFLLLLSAVGVLLTLVIKTAILARVGAASDSGYQPGVDLALSCFLGAVLGVYLYRSLRVVYDRGRAFSFVATILLLFATYELLQTYRHFLFYLTVHSL